MKPIERTEFSSSIYGVKLYIDDIELIISKIQNLSNNFKISDNDNIYQDLDELRKYKGDNPQLIKIENRENFDLLFIRIVENIASINCRGEAFLKEAYEIEEIFIKRRKHPIITYFFNPENTKSNLINFTIILGVYYSYKGFYLKETLDFRNGIFGIVVGLLFILITLLNQNFNGRIELKRKHESSFWEKNKDAILIAIISAIITGVITYLIQK